MFKLSPSGTETVLYSFTGGSDGNDPQAGLIADRATNLPIIYLDHRQSFDAQVDDGVFVIETRTEAMTRPI